MEVQIEGELSQFVWKYFSKKKKLPTDRVAQSLGSTLFKLIIKLCWQWVKVANIIIEWNDEVCPYSIWAA